MNDPSGGTKRRKVWFWLELRPSRSGSQTEEGVQEPDNNLLGGWLADVVHPDVRIALFTKQLWREEHYL